MVELDSILPSNIIPEQNMFAHSCCDNFDINEETPSGAGTTHSTHGIVVQEIIPSAATAYATKLPLCEKSKQHSFHYKPPALPTIIVKKKAEPTVSKGEAASTSSYSPEDLSQAER